MVLLEFSLGFSLMSGLSEKQSMCLVDGEIKNFSLEHCIVFEKSGRDVCRREACVNVQVGL